jgi:hypothetical protein
MEPRPAAAGPRRRPGRVSAGRLNLGLGAVVLVTSVALASGCGGGSLDSSTVQLQDGTEVSAQQYLADTSAAVMSIGEFSATLDALGANPNPQQMRAAANALAGPLAEAEIASQRLEASRLADSRLEDQRAEAARWMNITVSRMAVVVAAAEQGNLPELRRAAAAFAEALEGLRAAGESSPEGA